MTDEIADQPFTEAVVAAVCAHMNDDHAADSLVICRALGDQHHADAARMVGLDAFGADFSVATDGRDVPVRIPWSRELTTRGEVRTEVVRMYQEACAVLGIEAHAGGEH